MSFAGASDVAGFAAVAGAVDAAGAGTTARQPVVLETGSDPGLEVVAAAETALREVAARDDAAGAARAMLGIAEDVLAAWAMARGDTPTSDTREGFRLLALHRQGAQDLPSFNACRETCREIAWHYNLLSGHAAGALPTDDPAHDPTHDPTRTRAMMALLVNHLALFVGGKMHAAQVGEFCCASRPLREQD